MEKGWAETVRKYRTLDSVVFLSWFRSNAHYRGYLKRFCGEDTPLRFRLTRHQVVERNKISGFGGWKLRSGSISSRFDSKDHLARCAISVWKNLVPEGQILILGSPARGEPQPILAPDVPIKEKLNAIYQQCEDMEWYEHGRYDEVEELCVQWLCAVIDFCEREDGR